MARRGRFELPTPRFVVWCSIQLSYRRIRCLGTGGVAGTRAGGLAAEGWTVLLFCSAKRKPKICPA